MSYLEDVLWESIIKLGSQSASQILGFEVLPMVLTHTHHKP